MTIHQFFSLKMSKELFLRNYLQKIGLIKKEPLFCSMSLESWSAWVTKQRQEYSQREKLAPPIKENEFSLWVYDQTSQTIYAKNLSKISLTHYLTQNTPLQNCQLSFLGNPQDQYSLLWTTIIARDSYEVTINKPLPLRSDGKTRLDTLPRQVHHFKYGGKLNPRWVETMMGLPVGWTNPRCLHPLKISKMKLNF